MHQSDHASTAARLLCDSWQKGHHFVELPAACRPSSRAEAFAIQALWPEELNQATGGWKIAATSTAGQRHIGVSGPIAGPMFAHRIHDEGSVISLAQNRMRVAECEIVFRLGRTLSPRNVAYARDEVVAAVASLHPGIEVPDSRFLQFEKAGEAQLVADCACTNDMLVGGAVPADERVQSLPALVVRARHNGSGGFDGIGANVLGDPVEALVWIVNELTANGRTLEPGHVITTGACVPPIPVLPGDRVEADFGWIGRISARFS